jgi:hypothetical protein
MNSKGPDFAPSSERATEASNDKENQPAYTAEGNAQTPLTGCLLRPMRRIKAEMKHEASFAVMSQMSGIMTTTYTPTGSVAVRTYGLDRPVRTSVKFG